MTEGTKHVPMTDDNLDYWREVIDALMRDDNGENVGRTLLIQGMNRAIVDLRAYRTALRAIAALQASSPELRAWRMATKALAGEADFSSVATVGRDEDDGDDRASERG